MNEYEWLIMVRLNRTYLMWTFVMLIIQRQALGASS